jgi:micrococcal nuclease
MMRRPLDRRHAAFATAVAAAALLVPLSRALHADDTGGERARVESVVDGDTIRVSQGVRRLTIRLIGVDAPETGHGDRAPEPFGAEATILARRMLAGRSVTLEYDGGPRLDRYGRTLAFVRLEDGRLFNEEIIRAGYARVYERFSFRHKEAFRAAEREAQRAARGMWAGTSPSHGPIVGNRRSRIYHRPGQSHYGEVSERNRVYFENEEAARAAGYRAARE